MGRLHRLSLEMQGFFQQLPDLLRPRVLAEGYDLHAEDEGKQVYIQSEYALKRKPFSWWSVSFSDIVASMKLTVGYVLMPDKTTVAFTWENVLAGYWGPFTGKRVMSWVKDEASLFEDYLRAWYKASQKQIDTK